jgi:general secretion pathway protein M
MRLTHREKGALTAMAIFFAVLGFVMLVILPASERRHELNKLIAKKESELNRVLALRDKWVEVSKTRDDVLKKINDRGKDFAIFSYLENLATEAGLKDTIQYMRPLDLAQGDESDGFKKRGLEVRLKGVEIEKMVNYLYKIEYSDKMLKVETLHLKPVYTDPQFINATFRVVTYEPV